MEGNLVVGASTPDVVLGVLGANPEIAFVQVFDYGQPPLLQERIELTLEEQAMVSDAVALRARSGLPFWEALLLACFDAPSDYERFLRQALHHQSHRNSRVNFSRKEVEQGKLHELTRAVDATPKSLSSTVLVRGNDEMHMPMMDFHCPESSCNDRLVAQVCRVLFSGRVLVLASGESYHAIGIQIVDWNELRRILTQSLLLGPIIDTRYVAHQLMEGACALRLGPTVKKQRRPTVKFLVEG